MDRLGSAGIVCFLLAGVVLSVYSVCTEALGDVLEGAFPFFFYLLILFFFSWFLFSDFPFFLPFPSVNLFFPLLASLSSYSPEPAYSSTHYGHVTGPADTKIDYFG